MKFNEQEFNEKVINTWGNSEYKGKAIIKAPDKLDFTSIVATIIRKMKDKNSELKVLIISATWNERVAVLDKLQQEKLYDSSNFVLLTTDYFNSRYHKNYDLVVVVDITGWSIPINDAFLVGKFKLGFIFKSLTAKNYEDVSKNLPIIDFSINSSDLYNLRLTHPVEEEWIGVEFNNAKAKEDYTRYCDYIAATLNIFTTFGNIELARKGSNDKSSEQILNEIAAYNGWSANMDTSMPFNKDIDNFFNPVALRERANTCYDIIRKRQLMLTDADSKLDYICDLVEKHQDKNILIISKRGEYAAKVTEAINFKLGYICGDYHDKIEPRMLVDDKGKPILVKSKTSVDYGKPKIVKSQYISSTNERLFNAGKLNVMSIKNSSSESLKINVDMIILTSPLCETIEQIKYRFANLMYSQTPLKVYKLYMVGTIEEKGLKKEKETNYHKILSNVKFSNTFENIPEIVCE